jgi:hypothetical protein
MSAPLGANPSRKFVWSTRLDAPYLGKGHKDKSVVNSTFGLRVLLQTETQKTIRVKITTPREAAVDAQVPVHLPRLLGANLRPANQAELSLAGGVASYSIRPAVRQKDPDGGGVTRGYSTLTLAPIEDWPTPQETIEIPVPSFALVEQRLRVLISAKGGTVEEPKGIFGLVPMAENTRVAAFVPKMPNTGNPIGPRIELPAVTVAGQNDGPFIAVDLVPDGIELRATVANPLRAFASPEGPDRIAAVLRLVHRPDPLQPRHDTLWSLELVEESRAPNTPSLISKALEIVRKAFLPGDTRPVLLDIDTVSETPRVRWPLTLLENRLQFPYDVEQDWDLWVDSDALDAQLTGVPVRGGQLSTAVGFSLDVLALTAKGTRVDLAFSDDRRDPRATGDPDTIKGPRLDLTWTPSATSGRAGTLALALDQPSTPADPRPVTWFLADRALSRALVDRYTAAGVHPAKATVTYAFLPVVDGWLQLPLDLPDQPRTVTEPTEALEVPFSAAVDFAMPNNSAGGPCGRRLTLTAGDYVRGTASFAGGTLKTMKVEILGVAGSADGLLWVAASSPSAEEVLPTLDAGPVALEGPPLNFRRPNGSTGDAIPLTSSRFAPRRDFTLSLAAGATTHETAYLWHAYSNLPLVTAVALTRTTEGSGRPSASRGLLCRTVDLGSVGLIFSYGPHQGIPKLIASTGEAEMLPLTDDGTGAQQDVPLVPVSLAGVEFQPDKATFADLKTRLRFDLPALDELFANARLPEKAPGRNASYPETPIPDAATALDPEGLMAAWRKAADRLGLTRVQASMAFDYSAQKPTANVTIGALFEGATWTTPFDLDTAARLGTETYAFGSYSLTSRKGVAADPANYVSGSAALQGLSQAFDVNGAALAPAVPGSGNLLRVIGFAAQLWKDYSTGDWWRDSRAALTQERPRVEPVASKDTDQNDNALIVREVGIAAGSGVGVFWRATLAAPIPVDAPDGDDQDRTLGLWFRDLPLDEVTTSNGQPMRRVFQPQVKPAGGGIELAIGPLQGAFDPEILPRALYEWRFCNDAAKGPVGVPSRYDIAIGPLRFRPLRLFTLGLANTAQGWTCSGATVIGTVALADDGTDHTHVPFAAERTYQTGNLVAIELVPRADGSGLTFKGAKWQKANVDADATPPLSLRGGPRLVFRQVGVPVRLGGDPKVIGPVDDANKTTFALILNGTGTSDAATGLPNFATAALDIVLFGRRVQFGNGTAEVSGTTIVATFAPYSPPVLEKSGLAIALLTVTLEGSASHRSSAGPAQTSGWHVDVAGKLEIRAVDPDMRASPPLLIQELGKPLHWLSQEIALDKLTTKVDHRRGVIDITCDWVSRWPAEEAAIRPLAGFAADTPTLRGRVMCATEAPPEKSGDEKPEPDKDRYLFAMPSGFAGFNLVSKLGPITRFDHTLIGSNKSALWTSSIKVDLTIAAHRSRIRWPVESLPPTEVMPVDQASGAGNETLATLAARVRGRALRGKLAKLDPALLLYHEVTFAVTCQPIGLDLLGFTTDVLGSKPRVTIAQPWRFHALVGHAVGRVKEDGSLDQPMRWSTLDHVSAIDVRDLVRAAKSAVTIPAKPGDGVYAFAARYRQTDTASEEDEAVKGGLVLRAFAQAGFPVAAMAAHLSADLFIGTALDERAIGDGIVISGAGSTVIRTQSTPENPFWPDEGACCASPDPQGVFLAMPWLTALPRDYDFGATNKPKKLAGFGQAPKAASQSWDAPDVDWAAGSPIALSRKTPPPCAFPSTDAAAIGAVIAAALEDTSNTEPPAVLVAVDQSFLRPDPKMPVPDITERPLWFRNLLALRTVFDAWKSHVDGDGPWQRRLTMLVPSSKDDGRVARFTVTPQSANPGAIDGGDDGSGQATNVGGHGSLIAIDRATTLAMPLPASEANAGVALPGSDIAPGRARLLARAERLVREPIAVLAIRNRTAAGLTAKAEEIWVSVAVPPDLDDGTTDIPVIVTLADRLYASPALGWPTAKGTAAAASGALGMGEDRPFQDAVPDSNPTDVKGYGSGFAGRAASLSLPARAEHDATTSAEIDVRAPAFYALGRKMVFERPEEKQLPVVAPPARHLSPTEARVVVPTAQDLADALSRVVPGTAMPIVPPHLQRITLGLRPGAMQAEFDMLLFSESEEDSENFDGWLGRFGRPGHAGPRLVRQQRAPRAPALPRVPAAYIESHGRRTFVELDDLLPDRTFARPFALFEGVATVLRRSVPEQATGKPQSYHIRVKGDMDPGWSGNIVLDVSSPSYETDVDGLATALAQLGFLSDGASRQGRASATISVDRFAAPFKTLCWDPVLGSGRIMVTLSGVDPAPFQSRLDAVDGDSEVVLNFRCAMKKDGIPSPSLRRLPLDDGSDDGSTKRRNLEPETRLQFALRLPVRPTARPSQPVRVSTLVFADPSYDRALSGPGISNQQRDRGGELWKLVLDRFVYGTDTPLYFAAGRIDATRGTFTQTTLRKKNAMLSLQRQPASQVGDNAPPPIDLKVLGLDPAPDGIAKPAYAIDVGNPQAYAVTLDRLRVSDAAGNLTPVAFADGDQIVVSVTFNDAIASESQSEKGAEHTLSARAMVVQRPVIAPPPAVYALVAPEGSASARVLLHATGPLPQRIEFPDILGDLALGHIRRRALFIWTSTAPLDPATQKTTLVKIDRSGGGQLPDYQEDMVGIIPL